MSTLKSFGFKWFVSFNLIVSIQVTSTTLTSLCLWSLVKYCHQSLILLSKHTDYFWLAQIMSAVITRYLLTNSNDVLQLSQTEFFHLHFWTCADLPIWWRPAMEADLWLPCLSLQRGSVQTQLMSAQVTREKGALTGPCVQLSVDDEGHLPIDEDQGHLTVDQLSSEGMGRTGVLPKHKIGLWPTRSLSGSSPIFHTQIDKTWLILFRCILAGTDWTD